MSVELQRQASATTSVCAHPSVVGRNLCVAMMMFETPLLVGYVHSADAKKSNRFCKPKTNQRRRLFRGVVPLVVVLFVSMQCVCLFDGKADSVFRSRVFWFARIALSRQSECVATWPGR
jgi:hypothetical protein